MSTLRTRLQPFRSFRSRLTLFFVGIVIIPMVVVAVVLFLLVSTSETGKTDARLAQSERAASGYFQEQQREGQAAAEEMGADAELSAAIRAGDRARVADRLRALARTTGVRASRLELTGMEPIAVGAEHAVAPAVSTLIDDQERQVGRLVVSMMTADTYARQLRRFTRLQVILTQNGETIASTMGGVGTTVRIPLRGTAEIDGRRYRLGGFPAPAFGGGRMEIHLLARETAAATALSDSSLIVAGALLGFLVLAFAFALTVSRSLQSEIQRLLVAAQRLGAGDFSVQVPAEGNDEFAALGKEFNSMARQLEARLDELQRERGRLQGAIRRVGESFAKGLDRDDMLGIVVQTAVDGVGADCGRARVRARPGEQLEEVATAGDIGHYRQAIHAAETAVLDAGEGAEIQVGGATALALPLHTSDGADRVLGIISVARAARPFSDADRELCHYLASQAGISIENVGLHEAMQRQAVTDELTGLFNHRRFQEVITTEVERTRRFGSDMGLIMLDLDNFKRVNDTYGHMQGDLVLREVARVLRESSREIDEPARYGGEEMAVALPHTDLEGAYQFAERVRRRIEALELPILDGGGTLKVTASLGAAALGVMPGTDKDSLVAAADAALYRAKRSGKNRTVKAE